MQDEQPKDAKQINIISGIYPSFIYFGVPEQIKKSQHFLSLFKLLKHQNIVYSQVQQLHLSITKTLHILQSQAIQFQQQIKKYFGQPNFKIILLFDGYEVLNQFIVLKCSPITSSKINPYVERMNSFLKKLSQPTYFQNPTFHVSVCRIKNYQPQIQNLLQNIQIPKTSYLLNKMYLKIGNKIMQIN